jgi:hypothetical protein
MRGRLAPPDRFFPTASSAASGSDYGAIHTPQFLVDVAQVDARRTQSMKNLVERAVVVPFVEQVPHGAPFSKFLRQITPWCAGSHDPQNAINDITPIDRWPPRGGWRRKNVSNQFPLFIRQSISNHDRPPWQCKTSKHQSLTKSALATEDQFSDKA